MAELLAAGANTALTNTQGESCLYIAALRGHTPVVDCLLQHLTAKGLPWMVRQRLCSRVQAARRRGCWAVRHADLLGLSRYIRDLCSLRLCVWHVWAAAGSPLPAACCPCTHVGDRSMWAHSHICS